MIEINGAQGEGGGQILRTSLSLAALTSQSIHIHHIRSNRSQPGLRPQHLTALKAMAELTQADTKGASLHSTDITFSPGKIHHGQYQFDIPTAGALTLVLQTVFLPLSLASGASDITLTGGTHVKWSPIYHYLTEQWLPFMADLGFRAQIELRSAGFFPRGGGEVHLKILPVLDLRAFACVNRGHLESIRGYSGIANLPDDIAKRQKHQALRRLYAVCRDSKIKTLRLKSSGKGTFILLKANFSACGSACYTALGVRGKPAEKVADEAVDAMFSFFKTDGCVDHYLADQLLLPLAIIKGASRFRTNRLTQHLLTNAAIIQQFLPVHIEITGSLNEAGRIEVSGTNEGLNAV